MQLNDIITEIRVKHRRPELYGPLVSPDPPAGL